MKKFNIPSRYKTAFEVNDIIYFIDPDEGDENGNVICANKSTGKILSDNYFAASDLNNQIQAGTITKIFKGFENLYNEMRNEILRYDCREELALDFTFYNDNDKLQPIIVNTEKMIDDFKSSQRYRDYVEYQLNFEQSLLVFLSEFYGSFGVLSDKEWVAIYKSYKLTMNEF